MTAQFKPIPDDHIALDRYIDSNSCTLHDAVQQLATDRPEDEPWIVWLFEDMNSAIALPSKISLYGHDSLHAILNREHSPADETCNYTPNFSIADGMAAGFIAHAVVTVAQRNRQGMRSSLVLAGIAVAYLTLITVQA